MSLPTLPAIEADAEGALRWNGGVHRDVVSNATREHEDVATSHHAWTAKGFSEGVWVTYDPHTQADARAWNWRHVARLEAEYDSRDASAP